MDIKELTSKEVGLIMAALTVVMPTGGGSGEYALLRKIGQQTKVGADARIISRMAKTVIDDARDAGVIRIERAPRVPVVGDRVRTAIGDTGDVVFTEGLEAVIRSDAGGGLWVASFKNIKVIKP